MSFKNLSKYANSLLYFNRNKMKQIKMKQQIYYEFRNQLVFFTQRSLLHLQKTTKETRT